MRNRVRGLCASSGHLRETEAGLASQVVLRWTGLDPRKRTVAVDIITSPVELFPEGPLQAEKCRV